MITKMSKVLARPEYDSIGATSRMRSLQYLPLLRESGLQITVYFLSSGALLRRHFKQESYSAWPILPTYTGRWRALLKRRDLTCYGKTWLPY